VNGGGGGSDGCAPEASGGGTTPSIVDGGGGPADPGVRAVRRPQAYGAGKSLPFTGLPIAWVVALGMAMLFGGMSFIYRAKWRAGLGARR
jgi:hypothetical protein